VQSWHPSGGGELGGDGRSRHDGDVRGQHHSEVASELTEGIDRLKIDGVEVPIFNAAKTVMMPYTDVAPSMTISSIIIDASGSARVCWSEQSNATALSRGATVTIPAPLKVPGTSLIMATASFDYTPAIGYLMTGTVKLGNDPVYMRPRTGSVGGTEGIEQVERVGKALCPTF